MTNYCLVVMEGHLHRRYMDGLVAFSSVIELCSRPAFSERDLEMLGKHALDFFLHFEKEYYRYMPERVGLCKSTLHLLLHLKECVEACGPLVLYSQWWVERYVGFVKHRLHASVRAAESLTENARFLESYKMFFNQHFASSEDVEGSLLGEVTIIEKLSVEKVEKLGGFKIGRARLRDLLVGYIMKMDCLSREEAENAVQSDTVQKYGRIRKHCGEGKQQFGAAKSRRHERQALRPDFYIAAEFDDDAHSESVSVFYGRILHMLEYSFQLEAGLETRMLVVVDWAEKLKVSRWEQVYKVCDVSHAFANATVEDVSVILNLIGVVERAYPKDKLLPAAVGLQQLASGRRGATRPEKRTYFIDPYRRLHSLDRKGTASPDGKDRVLKGIGRT